MHYFTAIWIGILIFGLSVVPAQAEIGRYGYELTRYDTNRDQQISRAEYRAYMLNKIDRNNNGKISPVEWSYYTDSLSNAGYSGGGTFDLDYDVSTAELLDDTQGQGPLAIDMFENDDLNQDGYLGANEYRMYND